MDRNPFAPPVAAVADPSLAVTARPKRVVVAVALQAASLLIEVIQPITPPLASQPAFVVALAAFAALTYATWARQGWARWVLLMIFLLGVPLVVGQLLHRGTTLAAGIVVVQLALLGVAQAFMFTPLSNAWYRSRRKR